MNKKIGTILDEGLLKMAKQKAEERHTTFNHILEEALSEYLSRRIRSKQRLSPVESSFGAIALPARTVKKISEEKIYDIE